MLDLSHFLALILSFMAFVKIQKCIAVLLQLISSGLDVSLGNSIHNCYLREFQSQRNHLQVNHVECTE